MRELHSKSPLAMISFGHFNEIVAEGEKFIPEEESSK